MRPVPIAQPPSETPGRSTSILLVAEHALVRAGLRAVLGSTPGFAVVADVPDLASAAALAGEHSPDVLLVDVPPDHDTARAAMSAFRSEAPDACVLFLGDGATSGTSRCLPASAGVAEFCEVVAELLGGRCAACALRAECPVPRIAASLSPRERQVAVHVAAGLTSKQVAGALGIGVRTVNTYRESLARKLGASSAAVLTRYVIECGLDAEIDLVT